MQAVILAAGKSERFYPFNGFGHKSMVPLLGKPLLQHTLEELKKAKFTSAIIVVAKNSIIPDKITPVSGLSVQFVTQEEKLGMGHALSVARDFLEDSFFLLNGYHMDLPCFAGEMLKKQKSTQDVVVLAKEDISLERYGVVEVTDDRVVSVTEKPEKAEGSRLRIIGMYLLTKSFLQELDKTPLEEYHLEKALDSYAKSQRVSFVKTNDLTITLKHSWDILSVKDYLLSQVKRNISKKARIAESAIVEGNVVVSDDVVILENAVIKGPCFLGSGVVVGNNAIVRNGVIAEDNAVIGANMEIKNSVLMKGATTHSGFIGDSVIGIGTRIAGGFLSANVRFDRGEIMAIVNGKTVNSHRNHLGVIMGEKVDLGVTVATMPGITIGNYATIGPSTTVMENVEDNNLFYTKFQTTKKKKSIR